MGRITDDFDLYNDIVAIEDPDGAERQRKEHDKYLKWRKKAERKKAFQRLAAKWLMKGVATILGASVTAAIAFLVERWLSEHMK